jgi:hypothetical protein
MARIKPARRVTRDELQAAFAQVLGEGEAAAGARMPQVVVLAGAVVVAVLALTYLSGRRRGRQSSAVIEIKRL